MKPVEYKIKIGITRKEYDARLDEYSAIIKAHGRWLDIQWNEFGVIISVKPCFNPLMEEKHSEAQEALVEFARNAPIVQKMLSFSAQGYDVGTQMIAYAEALRGGHSPSNLAVAYSMGTHDFLALARYGECLRLLPSLSH